VLKPYEKYQNTEYDWLGPIPTHWQWLYLSQICTEKQIKNTGNIEKNVLSLSYGKIVPRKNIDFGLAPKDYASYQIVDKDNIILRLTDLQNDHKSLRTGLVKERGIITSAYTCLKPFQNAAYLQYLLHSYDTQKVFYGMGGGVRQSIGYKDIRNMRVPFPPREEQDQIVRFLDWKLAKINKLIRAKKKQIELLNEQKQVIINNAVTKGLDPNVPMKDSGIEWIGTIPEHWKVLYLSQTATEQSISNKDIRNQNLLSLSYGKIINKDINTTDGLLPASFDTYQIVHNGNIILRLTDLQNDHKSLRVGLVTQTGIITSAYTCLLPRRNVVPEFLYLLLHSYDVCKVFYGMGGGVRQSIGFDDIRRLLIPVPPLGEQKQIADSCNAKSDFIEGLIVNIEKEILLLTEYRIRLISDVVTGKTDVRGINVPEFEYVEESIGEDGIEETVAEECETEEE
jgi:type I restriction enzyme S subunit